MSNLDNSGFFAKVRADSRWSRNRLIESMIRDCQRYCTEIKPPESVITPNKQVKRRLTISPRCNDE